MVVLTSGEVYIKSEPEDDSGCRPSSALSLSLNTVPAPLSPPPLQPMPICECGNPAIEKECAGYGNPENMHRKMYVCARLEEKKCRYFKWKDELEPSIKKEEESIADARETPETPLIPSHSLLTPPTSPPKRPPPPTGTYYCKCPKLARQYFCQRGRPENVNKYYYRCPDEYCE